MGIRDLIDAFKKKRGKTKALNNVTFEVNKAMSSAFLGPTGLKNHLLQDRRRSGNTDKRPCFRAGPQRHQRAQED